MLFLPPLLVFQFAVNCNGIQQMPAVVFNINGHKFSIPASTYVRQVTVCVRVYVGVCVWVCTSVC